MYVVLIILLHYNYINLGNMVLMLILFVVSTPYGLTLLREGFVSGMKLRSVCVGKWLELYLLK